MNKTTKNGDFWKLYANETALSFGYIVNTCSINLGKM